MITLADTEIEGALKTLFQKNVQLYLDDKLWRSGKMLLFKQSGFFIELILQTSKKKERFEIPIPFAVKEKRGEIQFDYKVNTLINNNKECLDLIYQIQPKPRNKFFDIILSIKIEDVIHENAI